MILITGATGLVGAHIAKQLLADGEKVVAIKRSSSNLSLLGDAAAKITWVTGDVTDMASLLEAMQGVKKVYHCAALISFVPEDKEQMIKTNINGTANVVNACLLSGVEKLLYVSSVAAFGNTYINKKVDETNELKDSKDNFIYYKTKLYAEREIWRGEAEGLSVVVISPATILGNGHFHLAPLNVFGEVDKGLAFYPKGSNGFVNVKDVCTIAIRLMNSDISGEKYIVSAENLAMKQLLDKIATVLNKKKPTIALSDFLGYIAYKAERIKSFFTKKTPLITKETIAIAQHNYFFSNEKIKQTLNYNFVAIDDTIAEVAEAYRYWKSKQQ